MGESSSCLAPGDALRSNRGVEAPLFACAGDGADRLNAILQFDVALVSSGVPAGVPDDFDLTTAAGMDCCRMRGEGGWDPFLRVPRRDVLGVPTESAPSSSSSDLTFTSFRDSCPTDPKFSRIANNTFLTFAGAVLLFHTLESLQCAAMLCLS